MKRWFTYAMERFQPLEQLLILAFLTANLLLAFHLMADSNLTEVFFFKGSYIASFVVIFIMWFHIRVYDDVMDCPTDELVKPDRPMPRGLIGLDEARRLVYCLMGLEILITAIFVNIAALSIVVFLVCYSLLIYRDFYLGEWINKQREIYAFSHTVVYTFMAVYIYAAVTGLFIWKMNISN